MCGYGSAGWAGSALPMLLGMSLWGMTGLLLLGLVLWLILQRVGHPLADTLAAPFSTRWTLREVPQPTATDLLRERYARGEIDLATFEEMLTRIEAPEHRLC